MHRMAILGLFVILLGVDGRVYSIDNIAFGSNVRDVIASRGKPSESGDGTYSWFNSGGGKITLMADASGAITLIDLLIGIHEKRSVKVPSEDGEAQIVPAETGHVNYSQPRDAVLNDRCGAGLNGAPCLAFTLPGELEYIVNFGRDSGYADWYMSEIVIGGRQSLMRSGRIIMCGECGI